MQEGEDDKKLHALLGLYVLQIMVDNYCESEILVLATEWLVDIIFVIGLRTWFAGFCFDWNGK